MELDIAALMNDKPVILLFLIIGTGYLVGKIKIRGFELGSAAGVLFSSLFLGHYGFSLPRIVQSIGFVFFIYSVGFQSGPRFFYTFKKDGARYITLALVVAAVAFGTVLLFQSLFGFGKGYAAGILGGALTSTPTLAAAQDALAGGMVTLPEGMSAKAVNANITVGYAITYVFGLIGLLFFMRVFPRLLRIDLAKEAAQLSKKMNVRDDDDDDDESGLRGRETPIVRTYKVVEGCVCSQSLGELHFITSTGCVILKIKRDNKLLDPTVDFQLEKGDVVAVAGTFDDQQKAQQLIDGREVFDEDLKSFAIVTSAVVVTKRDLVGKALPETGIASRYGCLVDKLTRFGLDIPITAQLKIDKGDHLVLTGIKQNLDEVIKLLGQPERPVHETDLLTFAFGIVGGIILGTVTVKLGKLPLGIGMAGGLLISGLLVGHLRAQNPAFGRVPSAARFVLMELGILFFLAGVGLSAGHGLLEGLRTVGPQVFVTGVCVTVLPVAAGFAFGRLVLRMNPVILLGALAGSITSTPALVIINKNAKSSLPSLGYAGAYAFANILLTMIGQIVMQF
jgi:putative transport protein